jgi:hypothetical protein
MGDQGWNVVSSIPDRPAPAAGGWDVVGSQPDAAPELGRAPGLPSPELVDQQTTAHAATLAGILHARSQMEMNPPPVPAVALPYGLQTDQQKLSAPDGPTYQNPRTGRRYVRQEPGKEAGPLSVLDTPYTGVVHAGEGVSQMAEPGMRNKAGGLHKLIGGGLEAATPLMVAAGATAPVATAATLATGAAAQTGAEAVLKKIGIPEEYAAVAGDLVGLFAAAKTPKTVVALRTKYEPILKARFQKAKISAPEPSANSTGAEPYRPTTKPAQPSQPVAAPAADGGWNVVSSTPEPQGKLEQPAGANDGQPTAAVDARAASPLDTGTAGEGRAVHGEPAPGSRPHVGEGTDVLVPGEERSIPARYEVRELSDIQSSHNGQTFSANPKYEGRNERDYSKPENQQRVVEQSSEERFEPRYHITDNPDMGNGPPLIDERGNALGGNSRTMHLQRVYGRDGQKAAEYRALLESRAAKFGIGPEAVRAMRQPVLVRVATPEGLAALPGGSKWAVRKTNITGTAALSASERAAADAGQMSPEMMAHIAGAIEDAGPDATLNDALTGKSGTAIVNRLIAEGFFSEQERPGLMDGKTGVLTQSAKDRISKALLGKFFRDSDQISRTPASIRNKLERVAAPLSKVAGNPEWDITPDVREAIDLTEFAAAHGIKNMGDVVAQAGMFGEAPQWSDGAVRLAELLRDGKPNDVVSAFRKYVNSKEPTMFGESTPAEAFRDAFGAEKPPAPPTDLSSRGARETGGGSEVPAAVSPAAAGEPETGPHGPVLRNFHHNALGAIAELSHRRDGEAIGALHHPQVGDIDLVWGKAGPRGYGLAKISERHPEVIPDLQGVLDRLRETSRNENTIQLRGEGYSAIVRRNWMDDPKTWLLTAFGKAGEDTGPSAGGMIDVPGTHATERQAPPPGGPDSKDNGTTYMASGFGAFEPFLRESIEDMRALKAKRDAAIEELERSKITPGEQRWGEQVRHYFTGERDLWAARANQGIAKVRKLTFPSRNRRTGVDQLAEAIAIAREYKGRPDELKSVLGGYHPDLVRIEDPAIYDRVMKRIQALRPAIERALAPMDDRMKAVDQFYTNMAETTGAEGKRVGNLDTNWNPETYVPHVLNPKGEGTVAQPRKAVGQAMGGRIGKYFGFSNERSYPTLLDAVMNDVIPKTMNIHDAFTIQQDHFARSRATRLLEDQLKASDIGKYTVQGQAPEGWVKIAPQSNEFRQLSSYPTGAIDEEGQPVTDVTEKRLFVKKFIEEALRPITSPDFTTEIVAVHALRITQAATKAAQLGLSFFHATTENYMALANMGPKGWAKALAADRDSPRFLAAERDMIAHGGTTSIQGNTVEAYRAMQPGSIPTYGDIWRQNAAVKIMDQAAHAISDFTFANLQRKFKVTDYQLHTAAWLAKNPDAYGRDVRIAKQGIAKEVNAIYGGLHWENIGLNKATVEIARAVFLAPDWTLSNVFNVKYAFEKGPAGQMARMFWARTLVGGAVATQAMSLMLSGKLSKRPTMVYMGKDSNGEDIFQNVFFKGPAGDATNLVTNIYDYGLQGIARSIAGKGAPVVRTVIQIIGNRDYLGHEIAPKGMNPLASSARTAYAAAKSLLPVPLSLTNQIDMLWGPEAHKYTWPERLATMFAGNPPSHVAPAGTHMLDGVLRPNTPRGENSVLDQMETGEVYRRRSSR